MKPRFIPVGSLKFERGMRVIVRARCYPILGWCAEVFGWRGIASVGPDGTYGDKASAVHAAVKRYRGLGNGGRW